MRSRRAFLIGVVMAAALTIGEPAPRAQQALEAAGPQRFEIAIKNRKVDPAQQQVRVRQGDSVELTFTSDEAAELHLHGYDQLLAVEPNAAATLRLTAKTAGRFSLEAHGFGRDAKRGRNHAVLLYLEVYPR
jgi:FtsP/CotA-like multicopper oxidase with cupredoxin domain